MLKLGSGNKFFKKAILKRKYLIHYFKTIFPELSITRLAFLKDDSPSAPTEDYSSDKYKHLTEE